MAPLAALIVLLVVGVLYLTGQLTTLQRRILGQSTAPVYQTTQVIRSNVLEQVTATGPVAPAQTLPVSFKGSGKLVELDVQVGQKVKKGDVLAKLDTADLQAALAQAEAQLRQQQANFEKLKAGATPEQVEAARVALQNAQQAAEDAAAAAAASQASAARDVQAAQAQVATAQGNLQAAQDALAAAQAQAQKKLAADQTAVDNAQKALDAAKAVVATSPAVLQQQLQKAKDDLWSAQLSRDATCGRDHGGACAAANATVAGLQTAVDNFNATAAQTQQQNAQSVQNAQNALDTAKAQLAADQAAQDAAVKTAENNVAAAQKALAAAQVGVGQAQAKATASAVSAQQSANQAQGQVKAAQASLATTAAAPTQAELDAAAAQVANAQVAVDQARNDLDAAVLRAPMDGTVSVVNAAVGQYISGGATTGGGAAGSTSSGGTTSNPTAVITLVTLDDLQVTANVNEADIGKVSVGDPVSFTVSAFPGKTFAGQVLQIQPTGTTTNNVVNYAVTSSIKSVAGATLYPGMTAQVTITTDERHDVLVVPDAALSYAKSQGQNGAVMVLASGKPTPAKVTTGLNDGTNVEVSSGLQEGQVVVVGQSGGTTTTRTSTTTARTSSPLSGGAPVGPPPGA